MSGASYEERRALRESLRAFFARYSPEAEVRRVMATDLGYDPALWRRMSDELGLPGFALPVEYGGSGFGVGELQIVLEEMGRALVCAPFLSSAVLAANTLLAADDTEACAELLPGIADGTRIATLAALGAAGGYDSSDVFEIVAEATPGGVTLTGRRTFVPDALAADLFLVTATSDAGPALYAVEATAPGVRRSALVTLDGTRKQGSVEFAQTPARLIGSPGQGRAALERALVVSSVAVAAEHVGGARRALEMAVEYAKVREQFGRVIGSFQAIKHRCVEILLGVEAATSTVTAAAAAIDSHSAEYDQLAHLALGLAADAYLYAVTENIEIHGGIGFTWESAAHLYYKRGVTGTVTLGSPAAHRAALLTSMGR